MPVKIHRRFAGLLVLFGVIAVISGCWAAQNIPGKQRDPDTVGIVASQVLTPDAGLVVTLEDGQTRTFRDWGAIALKGSVPRVGDLFMSGTTDGQSWAIDIQPATAEDAPPGCFQLLTGGKDEGSQIVTALGLRLDRAPDFKQAYGQKGLYDGPNIAFCLDANGVATSWGT
jgi:hypothetical protein